MEKKQSKIETPMPKINENDGEILCNICGGRGCIPYEEKGYLANMSSICWKCQGSGKLDWLSFITGKPKKPILYGTSCVFHGTSGTDGSIGTNCIAVDICV